MRTLFSIDEEPFQPFVPPISGLTYLRDYISEDLEIELTQRIDREAWDTSWERRRQLYGGAYGQRIDADERPIPPWGMALAERIHREGLTDRPLDHMLVNEYLPGQGIALHLDYKPFDRTVISLSLLSSCVMDFRRVVDQHRECMLLEPRSLLVLSDDARYQWQHGIARRKNDRWQGRTLPRARRLSITFRTRVGVEKSPTR